MRYSVVLKTALTKSFDPSRKLLVCDFLSTSEHSSVHWTQSRLCACFLAYFGVGVNRVFTAYLCMGLLSFSVQLDPLKTCLHRSGQWEGKGFAISGFFVLGQPKLCAPPYTVTSSGYSYNL